MSHSALQSQSLNIDPEALEFIKTCGLEAKVQKAHALVLKAIEDADSTELILADDYEDISARPKLVFFVKSNLPEKLFREKVHQIFDLIDKEISHEMYESIGILQR